MVVILGTLTCAFVGTIAPNKPATISEEMENKAFNCPQSINLALRSSTMTCLLVKYSDNRISKNEFIFAEGGVGT